MEYSCKQCLHKSNRTLSLGFFKMEPIVMPPRCYGNGIQGVGATNPGVC